MPALFRNGRDLAAIAILHAAGGLLGWSLWRLGIPLAWMVGPLVLTGFMAATRELPRLPHCTRQSGQMIVASAVALYITPAAIGSVAAALVPIVGAAMLIVILSVPVAVVLGRYGRMDAATALFAALPGGPAEMANLAQRYGGEGSLVALTQTMRIAAIVILIPPLLVLLGNPVPDVMRLPAQIVPAGLALMLATALISGVIGTAVGLANPFFLGPLIGVGALSAFEMPLSDVPGVLLAAGQVLLGTSLGAMFSRKAVRTGRQFLIIAVLTTLLMIGFSVLVAWGLVGLDVATFSTLVLANVPGSVTEMAITAKAMHLDVSLVTAFHILRIFLIIPNAKRFFLVFRRVIEPHARPPS
jgi:membrane AbrB-like protein